MSEFNPHDMNAVIAAIHARLDEIRGGQQEIRTAQLENSHKLDSALHRISALESWKLWIYGMAAGISFVVAAIAAGVKWLFAVKGGGQQ